MEKITHQMRLQQWSKTISECLASGPLRKIHIYDLLSGLRFFMKHLYNGFICYDKDPLQRIKKVGKKVGDKVGNKKGLNSRRQRMITEMRDNPNITTSELHQILGISETAVENNLTCLKENGYVERVGSKKTGYWKVLE